jgi:hypothetical protein
MSKSKRKKKWRKKINPEKSNKMIYAVAGGLVIVFIAFVFVMLRGGSSAPPEDKENFFGDILKYIRRVDGFVDMKIDAPQNRVTIVYQEKERVDFVKIAQYAGMKLSNELKDETVEIRLAKNSEDNVQYTFRFQNGRIISP